MRSKHLSEYFFQIHFFRLAVCSLGEVAYYYDCSSNHSSDCFAILGPGSGSDSDRCCPHTDPVPDSG